MGYTQKKFNKFWLAIGVAGFMAFAGLLAFFTEDPAELAIKKRAEKIFAYDQAHPDLLPSHRVNALSIALGFANYEGAEQLVGELEPQMGIQTSQSWAIRSTVQNVR